MEPTTPRAPSATRKTRKTTTTRKRVRRRLPEIIEGELLVQQKSLGDYLPWLLVGAVLVFFLFGDKIKPFFNKSVNPAPAPVVAPVVPPSSISLASLPALTAKLQNAPAKAQALGALFRDWAATLQAQPTTLTTKQLVRAANTSLVTMAVKTGIPLDPQVGAEIDACLFEAVGGKEPGPVDNERVVAAFQTISNALLQIK